MSRGLAVLIAAVIVIPVAAVGMTGCIATNELPNDVEPSGNSQEETPRPSETEEATGPAVVGDIIESRDQLQEDQRAYELPDGSLVVVSPNAPLPEAVQQDVERKAAETPKWSGNYNERNNESTVTARQQGEVVANKISRATGKSIIRIQQGILSNVPGGKPWAAFSTRGDGDRGDLHESYEGALASAQDFINSQANPDRWIIMNMS